MSEKRFKKGDFEEDCPRFIPYQRDTSHSLFVDTERIDYVSSLFDIVDTEELDYVGFINSYSDINECNRDCNIMNVIDYLLKKKR